MQKNDQNTYGRRRIQQTLRRQAAQYGKNRIPRNRAEAHAMLFDYLEAFYNPKRLHTAPDYLVPLEFEKLFTDQLRLRKSNKLAVRVFEDRFCCKQFCYHAPPPEPMEDCFVL